METKAVDEVRLTPERGERLAELLVGAIQREYPNKTAHVLNGDEDARPPRELTPVFFGSFDWHSAVHSHWALLRLVRLLPRARFVGRVRGALVAGFEEEKLAGELAFQQGEERSGFEMPYGAAWLLLLCAELRRLAAEEGPLADRATAWQRGFAGLEELFRERLRRWTRALTHPIRSGEHSQSALALGFVLDWARAARDEDTAALVERRSLELYGADRDAPLAYEPSANDFLSPSLAEADLMSRVLPAEELGAWLRGFLGELPHPAWPVPVASVDPSDGKLAHFQGLNLSRAWMMERIAGALGEHDDRGALLRRSAREHGARGLAAVSGEHYASSHWLGSFAVYLLSNRPLPARAG